MKKIYGGYDPEVVRASLSDPVVSWDSFVYSDIRHREKNPVVEVIFLVAVLACYSAFTWLLVINIK